jgi:dephospho-CoA kinase
LKGVEKYMNNSSPASYESLEFIQALSGNDNRLLLGVTGGIASGKTTVADMLEKLGAPIIDFDILSRVVVESEKPAWKDIVSYFGEQILNKDKTLNREMMRKIVFSDPQKKKKLESFIHPRLGSEYAKLVSEYTEKDPDVIIQVVVPLLVEAEMQTTFHKLLMVYVPEEEQIKRLTKRDNCSKEMALSIINTQLSVEEKKGYCDFIIDNSGSLDETRKQVEDFWERLKQIQVKRKKSR